MNPPSVDTHTIDGHHSSTIISLKLRIARVVDGHSINMQFGDTPNKLDTILLLVNASSPPWLVIAHTISER